jgi:hypothetical protein
MLLKESRAEAHLRFANWAEAVAGERRLEYAETLGHHLERAHGYLAELRITADRRDDVGRRAADYLGAAGGRALARGDMPAAAALLERALALPPGEGPGSRELSLKLSIALADIGELSRAGALLGDRLDVDRAQRIHLTYRDGEGQAQLFDLEDEPGPVRIGRRRANEIALDWDPETSRHHVEFRRSPQGSWEIADLGSRNGTLVNGEPVEQPRVLRAGDVILVGRTVIAFHCPVQDGIDPRQSADTVIRPPAPEGDPSGDSGLQGPDSSEPAREARG